jgi:WD40 repeat protein
MGLLRFRPPISCLAYGRGNRWSLVGQGCDVQICNMTAGAKAHGFVEHRTLVTSVGLSPDGLTALSADESGELLWWDLATRRVLHRRQAHAGTVLALAVAPNGEYAATGGADGIVRLWDLAASCRECRLADAHWQEQVTALDFSADGRFLVAGGGSGRVDCWAVESGNRVQSLRGAEPIGSVRCRCGLITAAAIPEENAFVAHSKVRRWHMDTGSPLPCAEDWSTPTRIPQCAAFDHEGNRLLVAGLLPALAIQVPAVANVVSEIGDAFRDFFSFVPMKLARPRCSLEVWSLATGRRLHTFPSLPGKVDHLAVSPENTRILASMSNGDVQVFAMPGA